MSAADAARGRGMRLSPSPHLAAVRAYQPARPLAPCDLRLDGNEGATPPADLLREALAGIDGIARRYPAPQRLAPLFAKRFGVEAERVLVTAGADDALDRICRAMLAPGRSAVIHTPTFEMIDRYVLLAGGDARAVPWTSGSFPRDAMREAIDETTALVFVVTPNNPTGGCAPAADILALADAAPHALVVADLAYVEFADEDPTPALLARPNIVVTRTLSKAWGLAGLRVGCALGAAEVIRWLAIVGQPYAVSGPAVACAERWLREGDSAVGAFVARVALERSAIAKVLHDGGATVEPSQANFVLARVSDPAWLQDGLAGLGIAIRRWPGREGLEDAVRITCPGNEHDLARLLGGLRTVTRPELLLADRRVLDENPEPARALAERIAIAPHDGLSREACAVAIASRGASRVWLLASSRDNIQIARALGAVPIALASPSADDATRTALLEAGAARVIERLAALEEILR